MTLAAGTTLAGYRIDGVAGVGGMGVVYRATHLALDTVYGLKVIAPQLASDASFRDRFKRECRIAASIRHPNVIPIHHAGEEDGQLFLVMDLVEGSDLRELLAQHGPMPLDRAVSIFGQVASALDAAHARGLVHRDIKPANILVERETDHPYLTDFGLSKSTTSAGGLTKTGQWLGTVDYVAPEQVLGSSTDARTDVYALGCLLFHMLTAEVPFPKEGDAAKLWAHMNDEPPSLRAARPDVPGEVEAVVRRAMAKNPDDRQPSAGDLAKAVQAAMEGRRRATPERSVATGDAAWVDGGATRVERAPTQVPAPSPTATAQPAASAQPPAAHAGQPPPAGGPPASPAVGHAGFAAAGPAGPPGGSPFVPAGHYGGAPPAPPGPPGGGWQQGPPHAQPPPSRPPQRRRWPLFAGIAVALVLVAGIVAIVASGLLSDDDAKADVRSRIGDFAGAASAGSVCDQFNDSYVQVLGGRDKCVSQNRGRKPFKLDVGGVTVDGDSAVAKARDPATGDPWSFTLAKQGSSWLIDHTDAPEGEMRARMQAYAAAVGSTATCDLLSDSLISAEGGRAACERNNRSKSRYDPYQIKEIRVAGDKGRVRAIDPASDGGPVEFAFVKQNGTWYIDNADYLRSSAERDWKSWARAKGGKATCRYFSQGYLDRTYSGSRAQCVRKLRGVGAFSFTVKSVDVSGFTKARLRSVETGTTYDYTLIRVGRGWQIDRIKKR
jgi:hypothetical protein